jgi:DNA-directed RNA polymerase specialized sigma24 family protein
LQSFLSEQLSLGGLLSVKGDYLLSQEAFDKLLAWLGPDRDSAGKKYEEIRLKLIKIFTRRGCLIAEELADETMDRVCLKAPRIADTYSGDPALYFYGVAQKVFLEYVKKRPAPLPLPPAPAPEENEQSFACLHSCMEQLDPPSREFILEYYKHEKKAKIDHRRLLAERSGIALNTLRMRAHRIKETLQKCVRECMKQSR